MDVNLSHTATASIPTFNHETCRNFSAKHGLAVRAIAIEVDDAELAFTTSVAHGAKPSASPVLLDNRAVVAEVHLYGDVVVR
jgi:4-hydroxyphenylpyruvate dioxygenase